MRRHAVEEVVMEVDLVEATLLASMGCIQARYAVLAWAATPAEAA
jgi:hypothetical protein